MKSVINIPLKDQASLSCQIKVGRKYRRVRLKVRPDGQAEITAPSQTPLRLIEGFLHDQKDWLEIRTTSLNELRQRHPELYSTDPDHYQNHRQQAQKKLERLVVDWNRFYNLRYKKIRVRNSQSRWGSCSSQGNLNFNYKVAWLPPELADYIVVHEICHLQELNHSRDFWLLVAKTLPDFNQRRNELKKFHL